MSECGHASCTKKGYIAFCGIKYDEKCRKDRRARGIPEWTDRSPESYVRRLAATKQWNQLHPEKNRRKSLRYHAWCKEMFGGRIDRDAVARERWSVWRTEQKSLRIEKQIECRKAYINERENRPQDSR